jgi:beta-fructofuranosidase
MTHEEKIKIAQLAQDTAMPLSTKGRFRQKYHFMAPSGWINDPNGCIWYQGRYHLFYQHNPYAPVWGAMHWGHAVSADLLHWEHEPIALAPSEIYDDHPQSGVFSGSAIEFGKDLAVLYTGTAKHRQSLTQTQCLALSRDGGRTFTKYIGNPVIGEPPPGVSPDFRDPRMFCFGEWYYAVLGASLGKGAWQGGEGCACLYHSKDLKHWEYHGIIARSNGKFGSMWECPDIFLLDGKWVLTFSPMFMGDRKTVYLIGEMNFETPEFIVENEGEIDWGFDYYAVQSFLDGKGRRIFMAWQNGWDWMPWWNGHGPTEKEFWRGTMALPRKVFLDQKNRLVSAPVEELESLCRSTWEGQDITVGYEKYLLPCADPVCFGLLLEIDLRQSSAKRLLLLLRSGEGRQTEIILDFAAKKLIFNRSNADEGYSKGSRECTLLLEENSCVLKIFSDTVSIELFTDGGRTCMSNTIYPTAVEQNNFLSAQGGIVHVKHLSVLTIGKNHPAAGRVPKCNQCGNMRAEVQTNHESGEKI